MPQFYDIIMHLIRYGERAQIALRNVPFCLVICAVLHRNKYLFTTAYFPLFLRDELQQRTDDLLHLLRACHGVEVE